MASPKAFSEYINDSRFQKSSVLMEQISCEVVGFEGRDFCPVSLFEVWRMEPTRCLKRDSDLLGSEKSEMMKDHTPFSDEEK